MHATENAGVCMSMREEIDITARRGVGLSNSTNRRCGMLGSTNALPNQASEFLEHSLLVVPRHSRRATRALWGEMIVLRLHSEIRLDGNNTRLADANPRHSRLYVRHALLAECSMSPAVRAACLQINVQGTSCKALLKVWRGMLVRDQPIPLPSL